MSSYEQASSLGHKLLDFSCMSIFVCCADKDAQVIPEVRTLTVEASPGETLECRVNRNTHDALPTLIQPGQGVGPELTQFL